LGWLNVGNSCTQWALVEAAAVKAVQAKNWRVGFKLKRWKRNEIVECLELIEMVLSFFMLSIKKASKKLKAKSFSD